MEEMSVRVHVEFGSNVDVKQTNSLNAQHLLAPPTVVQASHAFFCHNPPPNTGMWRHGYRSIACCASFSYHCPAPPLSLPSKLCPLPVRPCPRP